MSVSFIHLATASMDLKDPSEREDELVCSCCMNLFIVVEAAITLIMVFHVGAQSFIVNWQSCREIWARPAEEKYLSDLPEQVLHREADLMEASLSMHQVKIFLFGSCLRRRSDIIRNLLITLCIGVVVTLPTPTAPMELLSLTEKTADKAKVFSSYFQ